MTEGIKVGDWVFLDDEDEDNRMYHEVFQERFGLEFNKKYLVAHTCKDLVYLGVAQREVGLQGLYSCFHYRVRLADSLKEIVLWK